MLTVELVVRDDRGERVDPEALGVAGLVALAGVPPEPNPTGSPGGVEPPAAVLGDRRDGAQAPLASLEAVERAARTLAAVRAACVAAVGDSCPDGPAGERALDEVSCALLVSRRSAMHARTVAETLRAAPGAWLALAGGRIDQTRARIVADAVLEIPRWEADGSERAGWAGERAQLEADGLAYAAQHTARRLALFLRRRLLHLGCPERPRRRRTALAERGVWIAHDGDGTAELVARLASEDAERVYTTIRSTALADRNGDPGASGDPREPMGTWLAAALVDLVLGGLGCAGSEGGAHPAAEPDAAPSAGAAGCRAGSRAATVVNVTVPIDSLAGLTDAPGILNGFGVIPADVARKLAAGDARWRHVLTSRASGAVLDVGTLSYRPPAALDRHVRLRDGTCRFPGCAVPARECDLDHLVPFPDGPTSADNLHALCRRHHGLKHDEGWTVEPLPAHALRWTSPLGATAITWPDDTLAAIA